jgi:hypothetical protein
MPKGPKGEKRPRDLNQWAKRMTDIVSGEVEDREPTPEEQGKDPAAVRIRRRSRRRQSSGAPVTDIWALTEGMRGFA